MYLPKNFAHNANHCAESAKLKLIKNYLRATSGLSHVVYLARLNIESKLAQEAKYDDIIKTFAEKKAGKVFLKQSWHLHQLLKSQIVCTFFRLNLVEFSLRILRIETKLRMHETFDAWIKPKSVKIFKRCASWKTWSPCFLFWKISTRNFFYFLYWAKLNVFWGFF